MQVSRQQRAVSPIWTAAAGQAVHCLLASADGLIAAGCGNSVLLVRRSGTAADITRLGAFSGPCTTVCFAGDRIVGAGPAGTLCAWHKESRQQQRCVQLWAENLSTRASFSSRQSPVLAAACSEEALLAVACSFLRQIEILDEDMQCIRRCSSLPACAGICSLCWLSQDVLAVCTTANVLFWDLSDGSSSPTVFEGLGDLNISSAACSPGLDMLAAGCVDKVVCLADLRQRRTNPASIPTRAVGDYESQVTCLAWDRQGKYLATMDGAGAAVWDMSDAEKQQPKHSIICCGHNSKSRITCLMFQPDDSLLATGGTDSRVLLFDSSDFTEGGIHSPTTSVYIGPDGNDVTGLAWLPGGVLVASTLHGNLIGWQLGADSSSRSLYSPTPPPTPIRDASLSANEELDPHRSGAELPLPLPVPLNDLTEPSTNPTRTGSDDAAQLASRLSSLAGPATPASGLERPSSSHSSPRETTSPAYNTPHPPGAATSPAAAVPSAAPDTPAPPADPAPSPPPTYSLAPSSSAPGSPSSLAVQPSSSPQELLLGTPTSSTPSERAASSTAEAPLASPVPAATAPPSAEASRPASSAPHHGTAGMKRVGSSNAAAARAAAELAQRPVGTYPSSAGAHPGPRPRQEWVMRQGGQHARPRLRSEGSREQNAELRRQIASGPAPSEPLPDPRASRLAREGAWPRSSSMSASTRGPLQETPQMARGSSLGQEGPRSRSGVSAAESSRGSREHTRGEPQELSSRSHTGDFQELASRSHTGASTERAQLSPSLMQRIQKVKQNALTPSSSQARELSGWGSGIPNAAQMPYGMVPSNMVPFVGHASPPMTPSFMIVPPHAMPGQPMVAPYAFAPAMPGAPGAQAMPSMMYIPAAHPPYMQQPWMSYPYIQQPMQGMASLGSTRSTSLPGSYMGRGSASDLERQGRFPPAGPRPPADAAAPLRPSSLPVDVDRRAVSPVHSSEHSSRGLHTPPHPAPVPAGAPPAAKGPHLAQPPAEPPPPAPPAPPPLQPSPPPPGAGAVLPAGALAAAPAAPPPEHYPENASEWDSEDDTKEVTTVYIGNLPPEVDEVILCVPFSSFGRINSVQVIRDKNTMVSRGFAFITYSSAWAAGNAMQNMNGVALGAQFQGRVLKVGPSHRC